ncbi:unnamed protein product, partial [Sphacelaria rigidula]
PPRRWRLEFRRPCSPPGGMAAAAAADEGAQTAGGGPRRRSGRRRPLPAPHTNVSSLSFSVLREVRWSDDGGRVFSVRVEENVKQDATASFRPVPPVPKAISRNSSRVELVGLTVRKMKTSGTQQSGDDANQRTSSARDGAGAG